MNTSMTTVAAVERALAERLEKLLVGMGGVEGISIVRNPAEFAKAFDLLAKFKLERGPGGGMVGGHPDFAPARPG